MATVGKYRGVSWSKLRLCDVFPHTNARSAYYFPRLSSGEYTGDHFRTQSELFVWIDRLNPTDRAQFQRDAV